MPEINFKWRINFIIFTKITSIISNLSTLILRTYSINKIIYVVVV